MRYVQDATEGAMRKNTRFYTRKRLGGGIMAMGDDGARGWPCRLGDGAMAMGDDVRGWPCRLDRDFDRAFGDFLQKARSVAPATPQFRPCLWRFFVKGTVDYAHCSAISTVPLTIFCKRHGRLCRLCTLFDRAFPDFLQKARSIAPSVPRFRPCL